MNETLCILGKSFFTRNQHRPNLMAYNYSRIYSKSCWTWFPENFARFTLVVEIKNRWTWLLWKNHDRKERTLLHLREARFHQEPASWNLYVVKVCQHQHNELFNIVPRELRKFRLGCEDRGVEYVYFERITFQNTEPSCNLGKRAFSRNLHRATYMAEMYLGIYSKSCWIFFSGYLARLPQLLK